MTLPSDVNEGINQTLEVAPRYWCPTSGNEYQHPGKCPECGDTLEIVEDVADQGKAISVRIDSLCVGNSGVSTSARVDAPEVSHVYLLSSEIVSLVEADRRTVAEVTCQN